MYYMALDYFRGLFNFNFRSLKLKKTAFRLFFGGDQRDTWQTIIKEIYK